MDMQTKLKVGGAIASAAITAVSLSLNALNIQPNISWPWIALISFLVFVAIVVFEWYRAENRARQLEYSRPSVVFSNQSPADTILTPINKRAFFTRLEFTNNTAFPIGDSSTAHDMIAKIIIGDKDGQVIDAWEGRWANTNVPQTSGEIWLLNRIDLPANNQGAILDIGYRFEGEKVFNGWDNAHFVGSSHRAAIKPGIYRLSITISAANMEERSYIFNLTVPDEPQSELSYPKIEWY